MKSILTLILLFSSVSAFAGTTYQNTGSSIKYDKQSNAIIIGQSQRGSDGSTRGIGTYIPLDEAFARQYERYNNGGRSGITIKHGEPPVYWHGKRVK